MDRRETPRLRIDLSTQSAEERSCSFFSILVGDLGPISVAVAPGQPTFTTMVLMVKEGSSARPRLK